MFYNYQLVIADRISTILARSRVKAGLSRRKISELVGISESTIKGWEAGQGSPTLPGAVAWFQAAGERPFRSLLDFLWPHVFRELTGSSDIREIRAALTLYFSEVAGVRELQKLHDLVLGQHGGKWSALLDMACAFSHSSLSSQYRGASLIQASYDLCRPESDDLCGDNDIASSDLRSLPSSFFEDTRQDISLPPMDHVASVVMARARQDAGVSLHDIAKAMGKTTRTISNWEQHAEPSFRDLCVWFHVINKPLWPYLRNALNPDEPIDLGEDERVLCNDLITYFAKADPSEARKLTYLIVGRYGSHWSAVLELLYRHIQSPLHQRILTAHTILVGYRLDQNDALLRETDNIAPDVEHLEACISLATYAVKAGLSSYADLEEPLTAPVT